MQLNPDCPQYGVLTIMRNIYLKILESGEDLSPLVLATVTDCRGSAPQKPGSSALFGSNGLICGTVGGGIVEGKVTEFARQCSLTKKSAFFHYQLNNGVSEKEEAICGGEVSILADPNIGAHIEVFKEINQSLAGRIPGLLITIVKISSGDQVVINRYWMTRDNKPPVPVHFYEKVEAAALSLLSSSDAAPLKRIDLPAPEKDVSVVCYLEPVLPLPQLIIAGAGHIGRALSHLGKLIDFEVTVIDDRAEFANPENLPDACKIIVKDIGIAMEELEKTPDSYIVIVTRGHNDDAMALKACIGSKAAYVGMIGSRAKVSKMHADFIKKKWATETEWNTIHSPIGLDINSKTVEEIAVSIAAQLVQVKNKTT